MLQTDAERGTDSTQQIINRVVSSAVATDPDTGAALYRSNGNARNGIPRWTLNVPLNGDAIYHRFQAPTLTEALTHSRAYLAKRAAKS